MHPMVSRWFLFGLLLGWSLTHATVFGQPAEKTSPPLDKLRQGLERKITVDFTGQSLTEVLNHIRDRSGLALSVDEQALMMIGMHPSIPNDGIAQQFQVKAKDEKVSTVLRKFLANYRLTYVVFEDSILVTAEEFALSRQMRQRVNVNVEDMPANKAIRELAKSRGINLVFDPKVNAQAETLVSLQVDNTGIETAVRLLAELASLKAVRMGNVVFVTSEEKAKKIRDEEQHQFDNPFNPNNPAVDRPVFGFGGGMIGGAVMPQRAIVAPGNPGNAPPPPNFDPPLVKPDGVAPGREAGDVPAPAKKVVIPVPPVPAPPQEPPGLDRPSGAPTPLPRREP